MHHLKVADVDDAAKSLCFSQIFGDLGVQTKGKELQSKGLEDFWNLYVDGILWWLLREKEVRLERLVHWGKEVPKVERDSLGPPVIQDPKDSR